MIVRLAKSEDYKDLMFLFNGLVEEDRYSDPAKDSFQKVIDSKNNFVLVAEENSNLVGFITASIRLVVRYPVPIMQVDEFYVDTDFRRSGVGSKLISEIENIAHENNIQRIYIESAYRHTLGHAFYEKNGYKNSGYYFLKVM